MTVRPLDVRVAHLDCEHDAAALRRGLEGTPGLVAVEVYPRAARVRLLYDVNQASAEALRERLTALGFPPLEDMFALPAPPKPKC